MPALLENSVTLVAILMQLVLLLSREDSLGVFGNLRAESALGDLFE